MHLGASTLKSKTQQPKKASSFKTLRGIFDQQTLWVEWWQGKGDGKEQTSVVWKCSFLYTKKTPYLPLLVWLILEECRIVELTYNEAGSDFSENHLSRRHVKLHEKEISKRYALAFCFVPNSPAPEQERVKQLIWGWLNTHYKHRLKIMTQRCTLRHVTLISVPT